MRSTRNYLRMRGEECLRIRLRSLSAELPPHARRREAFGPDLDFGYGITSACAEKRAQQAKNFPRKRNYLRMRGEENFQPVRILFYVELPPHARRRVDVNGTGESAGGITSACAEKSACRAVCGEHKRNYLRMRGEEACTVCRPRPPTELPPHARRRGIQ